MTKTSTEPKPVQPKPTRSGSWFRDTLVLIFRVLLLGIGGVSATLIGMAIATITPGQVEDTPLLEHALRQVNTVRKMVRRGPQAVVDDLILWDDAEVEQSSESESSGELSPSERQMIQAELATLQAELEQLRDRTSNADSSTNLAAEIATLRDRMATLETQLATGQLTSESLPLDVQPIVAQNGDSLRITLPSDVLFEAGSPTLNPRSQSIFDNVRQEIQNYPRAAVYVAAFTDLEGTLPRSPQRSFDQAKAVQEYLADAISEGSYHWVTVGYGQDDPAAELSTTPGLTNRRIEITVIPQS